MTRALSFVTAMLVAGAAAHPLLQAPDPAAPNPDSAYSIGPDSLPRPRIVRRPPG
jgi:hypothetical protein